MPRTPWVNQQSHLTSDRLKSKPQPNNVAGPKSKGKNKQQQSSSPSKSKEVRRIEGLLNAVRGASGEERDPNGGCFCLARTHELSPYSPICKACGLILCSLNAPQYRCPSCDTVLMDGPVRNTLISQLEAELASTTAKEEEEREKAVEEAQKAVGAFPSLAAATQPVSAPSPVPTQPQTHKVLSFTSKKRVVVSSYTTTPVQSRPVSRSESVDEDQAPRIPKPPQEPPYSKEKVKPERPWENLLNKGVTYRPRKRLDEATNPSTSSSRLRRGNKAKGKENDTGNN